MSTPAQPTQWPLRPGTPPPHRDLADEILQLRRRPADGKLTGLSVALADWLAVDVLLIRTLIVVASLSAGLGAIAYLIGWAITREEASGQAPLDRLGDRWRRLAPRTVLGWALGLTALGGLTFGSLLGFDWLPLIIIALTIWAGIRSPVPEPPRTGPPALGPRFTQRPGRRYQPTWAITLLTLCVAGLVGGAIGEHSRNPSLALSAALLIIGLGLLLAARHGFAAGLVAAGLIITLLLGSLILLTPSGLYSTTGEEPTGSTMSITDEAVLPRNPLTIGGEVMELDLSALEPSTDHTILLNATDAILTVQLPRSANVLISIEYANSVVLIDDFIDIGEGTRTQTFSDASGAPTLSIQIHAQNSLIEVI